MRIGFEISFRFFFFIPEHKTYEDAKIRGDNMVAINDSDGIWLTNGIMVAGMRMGEGARAHSSGEVG